MREIKEIQSVETWDSKKNFITLAQFTNGLIAQGYTIKSMVNESEEKIVFVVSKMGRPPIRSLQILRPGDLAKISRDKEEQEKANKKQSHCPRCDCEFEHSLMDAIEVQHFYNHYQIDCPCCGNIFTHTLKWQP